MFMRRMISILTVSVIVVLLTGAQQTTRTGPEGERPGILAGRVFAIARSGDIKPARIADVYAFYMYRSVAYANAHPNDENSAGMTWMEQHNKAMEELNKQLEGSTNWSESLSCRKELLTYRHAILETLKWAEAEKKAWQVVSVQTDEEGNFRVPISRPGKYLVLVRGRAGLNDAVWQSDAVGVTITPGQVANIKLASPEKACLDVEGE
jgi:hypothetical protein